MMCMTSVMWWCSVMIVMVGGHYTHEWAVHIDGGESAVQEVAHRHDFDVTAKVSTTRH